MDETVTDEELLRRYADGDDSSLDELYNRHGKSLLALLMKRVEKRAAEKIAAATWERLTVRDGLAITLPFRAWLARQSLDLLNESRRKRRRARIRYLERSHPFIDKPETISVYIDPGAADAETIRDLYLAISQVYESLGGSGLKIVHHEQRTFAIEEVPV